MNAAGLLLMAALSAPAPSLQLLATARFAQASGDAKRAAALAWTALGMVKDSEKSDVKPGVKPRIAIAVHREAQDILLAIGRKGGPRYCDGLPRYYDDLLLGHETDPVRRYLRARVEPTPGRRRRDLEAVLITSPDLFWAAYDLAELHAAEGDWKRAVEYAERAVGQSPGEPAAWNVLGHLRLESSRFLKDPAARKGLALKAQEALLRSLELDPKLAEAHYNLGLVRYALGEEEAARRSWLRAVELRSGFAEALNALGHARARGGELDEAVVFYVKALDARPDYGSAHNNVAVAYYRRGEHAQAYKHMAKAEAAGYAVVPSFRRAVVREIEKRDFMAFQRNLASALAADRTLAHGVRVFLPGADEFPDRKRPVSLPGLRRREIVLACLKARFRDSGGGVSLEGRRLRGKPVARYREAARVELDLGSGEKRSLLVIARESVSGSRVGRRRELVTWVADAGFRFSAEAPELARLLSEVVGLEVRARSRAVDP